MIDIESIHAKNRIVAWHGAQKWDGIPQLKEHKNGNYECGPGIYFTNHCETAQKYAKGSGSIMLMEIEKPRLLTIYDKLPVEEAVAFYESCYRLRNRAGVLKDLQRNVKEGKVAYDTMINCGVNNQSLAGAHGVELAKWLTDKGFDAVIGMKYASGEEWMVLFNPSLIKSSKKMPSSQIDWSNSDFSSFTSQIDKIDLESAVNLDPYLNQPQRAKLKI